MDHTPCDPFVCVSANNLSYLIPLFELFLTFLGVSWSCYTRFVSLSWFMAVGLHFVGQVTVCLVQQCSSIFFTSDMFFSWSGGRTADSICGQIGFSFLYLGLSTFFALLLFISSPDVVSAPMGSFSFLIELLWTCFYLFVDLCPCENSVTDNRRKVYSDVNFSWSLFFLLTWTSRVMGPLLSTSRISPFLVPTRMWPWPRDMARIEGLSSKRRPAELGMKRIKVKDIYVMRVKKCVLAWKYHIL